MQPSQPSASPTILPNNVNPQIPTEKSKLLIGIIIVLGSILIVIVALIVNTIFNRKTVTYETKNSSGLQNTDATKNANTSQVLKKTVQYKIIAQDAKDTVGRTVVYQNRVKIESIYRKSTEGVGWVKSGSTTKAGASYRVGVTGYYQGKESIKDSTDYYMLIEVPGEENRVKVRILNEASEILKGTPDSNLITALSVEDLNVMVTDTKNDLQGENNLGNMKYILREDFDRIFKKGDVLTFIFVRQSKAFLTQLDENDNVMAKRVSIRRFGGTKEIENEVYHTYPIKATQ